MKCLECNIEMRAVSNNHRYKECGLDNIILVNVKKHVCPECGEEYLDLPNPQHLHGLIAESIIKYKRPLNGKEFRFLRTHLGFSAKYFAEIVGVGRETLSRWENAKIALPRHMDLLIRSLIANNIPDRNYDVHDLLIDMVEKKKLIFLKIAMKRTGRWEIAEAA